MRIGIDARFLTHPQPGGFKTYTTNLVGAIAEMDLEDQFFLYLDRDPGSALPSAPNFTYRVVQSDAPMVGMIWREQVSLARQAARDHLDLFHAPCLTAPLSLHGPSIVTIHDTIWRFPRQYSHQLVIAPRRQLMEWYYRFVPEWSIRRAALVLTVSQAAKDSIIQQLKVPAEKVQVTYGAVSGIFHPVSDAARVQSACQKYQITRSFILGIGSADPRKNITTLIQAYALLPGALRSRFELVIVWNHPSLVTEVSGLVEKLGLDGSVRFVYQVPNDDLVLLYNAASLFVFPSLYEGFGLPLLEAMSCGVPVISAENSSIPEVAGDAALLVRAEDAPAMAHQMATVLNDPALSRDLSEKGLERAKLFSWKTCASQTLSAYHQAVNAGSERISPDREKRVTADW